VSLICNNNLILTLPRLKLLEELNCENNKLTLLKKYPNALTIRADHNNLQEIENQPLCKYLSIRHNNISQLPNLYSIQELLCSFNSIKEIKTFTTLVKLKCQRNLLEKLYPQPSLAFLNCSYNPIDSIPLLPNLVRIDCSYTMLNHTPLVPIICEIISEQQMHLAPEILEEQEPLAPTYTYKLSPHINTDWINLLFSNLERVYTGSDFALTLDGESYFWCEISEFSKKFYLKNADEAECLAIFHFNNLNQLLHIDSYGLPIELEELWQEHSETRHLMKFAVKLILDFNGLSLKGNVLEIHPKMLKTSAQKVFDLCFQIVPNLKIRFLDDQFFPISAFDSGGLTRQFIFNLAQTIFKNPMKYALPFGLSSEKMPYILHESKESGSDFFAKFGKLISFILLSDAKPLMGILINPNFFTLLHKTATLNYTKKQIAIELARPIAKNDAPLPPAQKKLSQVLDWYEGDLTDRIIVEKYLETFLCVDIGEDKEWSDLSDDELKNCIEEEVFENFTPSVDAILKTATGICIGAKAKLQSIPSSKTSLHIQGSSVDAENLIERIKTKPGIDANCIQKKEWIIEKILEKKDDLIWLTNFLLYTTGNTFLSPDLVLNLHFHNKPHFKGATCIYTLDVPITLDPLENPFEELSTPTEKDIFLHLLDLSIQRAGSFNDI
jgi:hypothetical protein